MRNILKFVLIALIAFCGTSCALKDLPQIEPNRWQKESFERRVADAVREAVQRPGIDNGSTLVVTQKGDTLIAPADTTLAKQDIRTVYVTIESPVYPKGMSSKWVEIFSVGSIAAFIGLVILLILIGIFIIVIRRQHTTSKAINNAILNNYELPESFFTKVPRSPHVTVNQIIENTRPSNSCDQFAQPDNCETGTENQPQVDPQAVREAVKAAGDSPRYGNIKDLRRGFILVGLGVIVFLAFAIGDNPGLAFIAGGTLVVLGLAKFLPLILKKF